MSKSRILNVANISFNSIRENKILAKISELTGSPLVLDSNKGPHTIVKVERKLYK